MFLKYATIPFNTKIYLLCLLLVFFAVNVHMHHNDLLCLCIFRYLYTYQLPVWREG
jgi:hypothetical protein